MRSGRPPRIRRSASSPLVISRVTAEEDRGVRLLERAQAAVGRAARFVRRRPGKVSGVEAGAPEADPQTVQPVLLDLRPRHVGHLEVGGQLDRQVGEGRRRDQHREDALAELRGQQELGDAPAGGDPFRRDQDDHRRAALAGLLQLLLPALTWRQAVLGIEIEERVTPALLAQPVADPDRRTVVPAGMADEQNAHDWPAAAHRRSGHVDPIRRLAGAKKALVYRQGPAAVRAGLDELQVLNRGPGTSTACGCPRHTPRSTPSCALQPYLASRRLRASRSGYVSIILAIAVAGACHPTAGASDDNILRLWDTTTGARRSAIPSGSGARCLL